MSTSRAGVLLIASLLVFPFVSVSSKGKSSVGPKFDGRKNIGINSILKKEQTLPNGLLVRYFMSDAEWSGKGAKLSDWYVMKTAPTPAGYKLWSQSFELRGDRSCMGVGDQINVKQLDHDWDIAEVIAWPDRKHTVNPCGWAEAAMDERDDKGVMWAFSTQGHSEARDCSPFIDTIFGGVGVKCDSEGKSAMSLGIITVNYAPPTYTGKIKRDYNCDKTKIVVDPTRNCYW
jgi:hypothetical protein